MLSVGLIEKYPAISAGLGAVLRERFDETSIHTQKSIEDFCEVFANQTFDVIILSFYEDSIELMHNIIIQRCKRNFPTVPILVFGEKVTAADVLKTLKFGVKGYVLKLDNLIEVVNCIEVVQKGKHYLSPLLEKEIMDQFIFNTKREPTKPRQLTAKQSRIANFLSKGMSTSKIAETLNLKASTVSTVKATIFQKMNVHDIIELRTVIKRHKF